MSPRQLLRLGRSAARVFAESGFAGGFRRARARALRAGADRLGALSDRQLVAAETRRLTSKRQREVLGVNAELRGRHRGERCFVLGAGASLTGQDLSRLTNELVISVNEMFHYLPELGVRPAYLVVQDLAYFSRETPGCAFLEDLSAMTERTGCRAVLNIAGRAIVEALGHFRTASPYYVLSVGDLLAYRGGPPLPLDLSGAIPAMYSVTHLAVAVAMYLGCSEIYIAGVDLDYIAFPDEPIRHCYGTSRYVDHDRLSARSAYQRDKRADFPAMLRLCANEVESFALLAEQARRQGQTLINLNDSGYLLGLPRRTFDELFPSREVDRRTGDRSA